MENQLRKTFSQATLKNKDKMRQIEQKIQAITESKVSNAKDQRMSHTLNRALAVDKKAIEQTRLFQTQVRQSKQLLKEYIRKADETMERQNHAIRNRNLLIGELEKKFSDILAKEVHKIKEADKRAASHYEERIEFLQSQMLREIEKRKVYFKDLDQSLSQNLPDLHAAVKSEMEKSNMRLKDLEDEIGQSVEALHEEMEQSQKEQQISFDQLMKMMGSVIGEVKSQISAEKQNRIASKNKLISLFEGAYCKLVK